MTETSNIWMIIIWLVLGTLLFYRRRRFYWYYGCLCWIVAVFTYLYPIEVASQLPYIVAVMVCFALVGLCWYPTTPHRVQCDNVDSNVEMTYPLYIGERTSSLLVKNNRIGHEITARVSELEKKAEWIVAVKVPAENGPSKDSDPQNNSSSRSRRFDSNRYNYLVMQAVSREINQGRNFPLQIPDTDINRDYQLNQVGSYKREPDAPVVIRNGHKIPGYPTNETAVNAALQVCNFTVYTYFKCVMAYSTTTSNFNAVMHICMLQRYAFIKSILNFCHWCAASIKCIVRNLFLVFIISGIIISTIYVENPHNEVNLTMEPGASGPEVAETVVTTIESAEIFSENHNIHPYVRRIAWVESKHGLDNGTYRKDYHGGLWQVDESLFLVTQNTSIPILMDKHKLVKKRFDTDWMTMQWEDLRIPLWSGLAVCLYMCTIEEEIPPSIHEQADHWNRNYNNKKEHPRAPDMNNMTEEFEVEIRDHEANISVCYKDVDLFVILDSSSSIKEGPYKIAKKFVADLVSGFTIGEDNVRVGLVIYGSTAQIEFDLDDSFDQSVILNRIRIIPYLNSATATGDAIKRAVKIGFTEARGARAPDLAIPRVAIVITDGESNTGVDVHIAAQAARDKSIELFAFGIGDDINDTQLLEIAGSQDRIFKIDSYANIDDARALIAQGSCKVGIKATTSTRYNNKLDSGQNRLFEYIVPKEGITVQLQVTEGSIVMYGSHNNPDPSPVWHDYMLSSIHGNREIIISHPTAEADRKEDGSTVPFYCNLVAIDNSAFSIKAINGTD